MPVDDAVRYMKEAAQKTYAKKGEKVVNMNLAAVDAGINSPVKVEVPDSWSQAKDDRTVDENLPDVVKNIVIPCNRQRGDDLPVSTFLVPTRTAPILWAPPSTTSAALPARFPSGIPTSACSATSAPLSAPTLPSAPIWWTRRRPRPHPPASPWWMPRALRA